MSDTPDTSAQKDVANRPNPALPRADSIRSVFFLLFTLTVSSHFWLKSVQKRHLFWDPLNRSFYRDIDYVCDFYEIVAKTRCLCFL